MFSPSVLAATQGTTSGLGTDRLTPESRQGHDTDGFHPRPVAHVTGILLSGNFCSFHPNLPLQGPTIPFFPGRWDGHLVVLAHPHPQPDCKTGLEQQLIFQEGLFLKLLQNRPTHQGLHTILSGDSQWETRPSCCLKTEAFYFTWQETGCNEASAATTTRGKVILY